MKKEGRKEKKERKDWKEERKDWKGEGTEREKCLLISSPFGTFEFPQS